MPIQYCQPTFIKRSEGQNAVRSAAYRSNEKLYCEHTGEEFNYAGKGDCVYSNIILPDSAYSDGFEKKNHPLLDRETLWNAVEEAENSHKRRKTAQLAFELKIALPKELPLEQQIDLVTGFVEKSLVENYGVAADICIHDKGDGNPHAHVMCTLRQVVGLELSNKKIRNIGDPVRTVSSGLYQQKGSWPQDWREHQNAYFKEHNIDLTVDQTHVIPTKHEGRLQDKGKYHTTIADENLEIKAKNFELARDNPEIVLKTLASRQSVFNDRDIKSLVLKMTDNQQDFDALYAKTVENEQMVKLGFDDSGRVAYTTRATFKREVDLMDRASRLSGKSTISIAQKHIAAAINAFEGGKGFVLSEEQKAALSYIAQGGDVVCLDGIAGAGKTTTMEALKAIYASRGIGVSGVAIAGKAAHGLEMEAGIASNTVASIVKNYTLGGYRERYLPATGSVLVLDEAGMIGLDDMATLVEMCEQRHIKLVSIGDPDQLASIARGAPFKAMMERIGFASLSEVRRQKDAGDREATVLLKQGKVGAAIDHYLAKDQIVLDRGDALEALMIDRWSSLRQSSSAMMLAFTCEQVESLNAAAREKMQYHGRITNEHDIAVNVSGKHVLRSFGVGDDIVFLKNARLGEAHVKNGQLASIIGIEKGKGGALSIKAKDRDGTIFSFDASHYDSFDHGYALTVHKSQGVTVDNTLLLAQDYGWDRHLSYVGMSRHRDGMYLFADSETYGDLQGLKRELARTPMSDNALDYPLSFAIRRGMDAEQVAKDAATHASGSKLKDAWRYLFNIDDQRSKAKAATLSKSGGLEQKINARQLINQRANQIAVLADVHLDATSRYFEFIEEHGEKWFENQESKAAFADIEKSFNARNELAYGLLPMAIDAFGERNRVSDAHSKVPLSGAIRDEFKRAMALNKIDYDKLGEWAKAHEALMRVALFKASSNPYVKGRLAQEIADSKESRKVIAKEDLWSDVNRYQREHILREKKGQIAGFAERLAVVDRYLELSGNASKYWHKSQAEHFGVNPDAVAPSDSSEKAANQLRDNLPPHQARYLALSDKYNLMAEEVAHQLNADTKAFGEVLAVKYPHRATFEKISERIAQKAARFDKRLVVRTYLDPSSSEMARSEAAYKMNQDYKGYFGIGRQEGLLWKLVARDAKAFEVAKFREQLDPKYQGLFDRVEQWQAQCREAAKLYRETLDIEKALKAELNIDAKGVIPKDKITEELSSAREQMYQTMAIRHELAFDIAGNSEVRGWVDFGNTVAFDKIHYRLDAKKFIRHVALHEERLAAKERVREFAALVGNDPKVNEARMELAFDIMQKPHKHRFYLKVNNLDERRVDHLAKQYQYNLDNKQFEGLDKTIHHVLADYMLATSESKMAFADIRAAKKTGVDQGILAQREKHAFELIQKRNRFAFDACALLGKHPDTPAFEAFLGDARSWKNIDIGALTKAADGYRIVNDISRYRDALGSDLAPGIAGNMLRDHKRGKVYHKVKDSDLSLDQFYRDATHFLRGEYAKTLDGEMDKAAFTLVASYSDTAREVANAFASGDKQTGKALIAKRNALALNIANQYGMSEPHLYFEQVNLDKLDQHAKAEFERQFGKSVSNEAAHDHAYTSVIKPALSEARKTHLDYARITDSLMQTPFETYTRIFGGDFKSETGHMRYSGGLIVTTHGEKAGTWYDFSAGVGGGPIQAIMHATGNHDFKQVLEDAAKLSGLSDFELQKPMDRELMTQRKVDQEKQAEASLNARIASARSIWDACVPANDTIVEKYMTVHRNIPDITYLNIRLLPIGATWEEFKTAEKTIIKTNKIPAMVIASHDDKGQIVGVQRTYLDEKTANKCLTMSSPKMSKGLIKTGAVLQRGLRQTIYIAEGIETGASIAATDSSAHVMVSMSVANMKNMVDKVKGMRPDQVVILKDNDGQHAKSDKTIADVVNAFESAGLSVDVKEPEMLERLVAENGEKAKTDWNDIIKEYGIDGLKQRLSGDISHIGQDRKTDHYDIERFVDLERKLIEASMAGKGDTMTLYANFLNEAERLEQDAKIMTSLKKYAPEISEKISSLTRMDALARHWEEKLLTASDDYRLKNHGRTREGIAERYFAKLEDTILPEVEKAIKLKAEVKQEWSTQREKTNQKTHSHEDDTSIGH